MLGPKWGASECCWSLDWISSLVPLHWQESLLNSSFLFDAGYHLPFVMLHIPILVFRLSQPIPLLVHIPRYHPIQISNASSWHLLYSGPRPSADDGFLVEPSWFWPISMHLLSANQTWLENPSSILNEFPIQTSVYKGFPVAMFDDRRVSMGKW